MIRIPAAKCALYFACSKDDRETVVEQALDGLVMEVVWILFEFPLRFTQQNNSDWYIQAWDKAPAEILPDALCFPRTECVEVCKGQSGWTILNKISSVTRRNKSYNSCCNASPSGSGWKGYYNTMNTMSAVPELCPKSGNQMVRCW